MKVRVIMPFYNTPMWGQTSVYSLLNNSNFTDHEVEIVVIDNMDEDPKHPRGFKNATIHAISEVPEFKDRVKVIKNPLRLKGHGTALDIGIRMEEEVDFLIPWETDMLTTSPKWLEWLLQHMVDPETWMAGFEFLAPDGGTNSRSWYVMPNPGIYRMDVLKRIDEEVRSNKDGTFYFGNGFDQTRDIPGDVDQYGAFSEIRGFKELHDLSPDGKGIHARPTAGHYENGQWLFFRMMQEGKKWLALQCLSDYMLYNGVQVRSATNFANQFTHYWAGTRSWDFMTHPEENMNQINYIFGKIQFEIETWRAVVPENIRKIVPEVYNECRNDEYELNNLEWIARAHTGHAKERQLSMDLRNWYQKTCIDTDFRGLL